MAKILDQLLARLDPVSEEYTNMVKDIDKSATSVRDYLLENNEISPITKRNTKEAQLVSLCAVDGASGMEKLQSGDILVAASSFSDGLLSKKTSQNREEEAEVFSSLLLHSSNNDKILSAMRAFTEISVLGRLKHDIIIIDGAYLGNTLTVFHALEDSKHTALPIIEALRNDKEGHFQRGLRLILDIRYQLSEGQMIVGLSKSDSSTELVKKYAKTIGEDKMPFYSNDKVLTEYMLNPGEYLVPAKTNANKWNVSLFDESANGYTGFKWDYRNELSQEDLDLINQLFNTGDGLYDMFYDLFNYHSLYMSYFKPYAFNKGSNSIRVEIAVPEKNDNKAQQSMARARTDFVTSYLNSDFNTATKEPYSQYEVDAFVKKPVSNGLKIYRLNLVRQIAKSNLHIQGVLDDYRT